MSKHGWQWALMISLILWVAIAFGLAVGSGISPLPVMALLSPLLGAAIAAFTPIQAGIWVGGGFVLLGYGSLLIAGWMKQFSGPLEPIAVIAVQVLCAGWIWDRARRWRAP